MLLKKHAGVGPPKHILLKDHADLGPQSGMLLTAPLTSLCMLSVGLATHLEKPLPLRLPRDD